MNIALLYFSGTGNTRWLAKTLAARLTAGGATVDLLSLEDPIHFGKKYDRYLLAHPVYGAHVPRFVIEKIQFLFAGDMHLSVIATYGYVNALGYFAEQRSLGRKVDSYYNVKMFNNITTPRMKTRIIPRDQRITEKLRIEEKIAKIAASILRSERRIEGIGPQLLVGIGIRKKFAEGLKTHFQTLGVDPERCIHCELCVRECPTHSIKEENNDFIFQATCTACMRCYNHCPTHAITINGVYAGPKQYPRYLGPWK